MIQLSEADLLAIKTALIRSSDLLRAQDKKLVDFEARIRSIEHQIGANRSDIRLITHREVIASKKLDDLMDLKAAVATITAALEAADKRMDRIATPLWAAIASVLVGAVWMVLTQPVKPVRATPETVGLPDPPAQLVSPRASR